jgi:hypothetical protein
MMMRRIGIGLILSLAGTLAAAEPAVYPVGAGERVRLQLESSEQLMIVNVVAVDEVGLTGVQDSSSEPYSISWASIGRIEVFDGSRSLGRPGAVFGAVILGALPLDGCERQTGRECAMWLGGSMAIGALVGYAVFSGIVVDRWVEVRRTQVAIVMGPQYKGAIVRLAVRF